MEKVKVTEVEANAIEEGVEEFGIDFLVDSHCLKQKNRTLWLDNLTPLNQIPMWKLARAVYIGYEVEPDFKVGDWVAYKDGSNFNSFHQGKFEQITSVDGRDVYYNSNCCVTSIDKVRHATPQEIKQEKERRWWASHNRDVWELREGDMLIDNFGNVHEVTDKRDDLKGYYLDYVSSNFVEIKQKYKVLVFVENRLDVKRNV